MGTKNVPTLPGLSQCYPQCRVRYWRDAAGPEVDFVLESAHRAIPIEVKWSDKPTLSDARHLVKFLSEYGVEQAYIVCRTRNRYILADRITVIPWTEVNSIFESAASTQ